MLDQRDNPGLQFIFAPEQVNTCWYSVDFYSLWGCALTTQSWIWMMSQGRTELYNIFCPNTVCKQPTSVLMPLRLLFWKTCDTWNSVWFDTWTDAKGISCQTNKNLSSRQVWHRPTTVLFLFQSRLSVPSVGLCCALRVRHLRTRPRVVGVFFGAALRSWRAGQRALERGQIILRERR